MAPTRTDFENGPLADHGVTVSKVPVTLTNDNITGDRIRSSGSAADISIVFSNPDLIFTLDKQGEQENADVKAYVSGNVTVNKEDELTWNTYVFRVESVSPRYFDGNLIYKKLILRLITPA